MNKIKLVFVEPSPPLNQMVGNNKIGKIIIMSFHLGLLRWLFFGCFSLSGHKWEDVTVMITNFINRRWGGK